MSFFRRPLIPTLGCLLLIANTWAQTDYDKVVIKPEHVGGSVHVLFGSGGNIGVSAGDDGVFLIDDQFAPLTDKIQVAVKKINKGPVRFVFNTHWHGDHTGGNENFGKAGAVIVAHDNVRTRMSVDAFNKAFNRAIPASPKDALPVVTFSKDVTFHLNGDTVHAFHVAHAHTDGDAMVYFEKANVLHAGDVFFNGMYPFVDVESGGDIRGIVNAVNKALKKINADTKIIPGHGPVTDVMGMVAYRNMLETIMMRVAKMIKDGRSLEEVQNSDVTKEYEAEHGSGFMKKDLFLSLVYASLAE